MNPTSYVSAPEALLLAHEITASAKVLWLIVRLDAQTERSRLLSPTRLARRSGLTRSTVRRALDQLDKHGWAPVPTTESDVTKNKREPSAVDIAIPAQLVCDASISVGARLLYGHLQLTPGFSHPGGRMTYKGLGQLVHLQGRTVRRRVEELAGAGWLKSDQANQKACVQFTFCNPVAQRSRREAAAARRRIERAEFRGEAIMREYLSLIIESDQFEDDAAPGFLVNPLTGERLQFDRYYPHSVAFEFNGPQHYGATQQFSAEQAALQRTRDLIKAGICYERGISLVVVHAQDLAFASMREKVGRLLPLRSAEGHWSTVNALESISRRYRGAARRVDAMHA